MQNKPTTKFLSKNTFSAISAIFLFSVFLYIFFIIQPELIFHHVQPPFILSPEFYKSFLKLPGGLAELVADLILQSFYSNILGSFVFLGIAFSIGWLTFILINSLHESELNRIWALIPFLFTIILANNYNFPFSVVVSIAFLLLILAIQTKMGKGITSNILLFTLVAIAVYWFAGSGYLLFYSAISIFVSPLKKWDKFAYFLYVILFAFLFPLLVTNYLVAVPFKQQYFYLFPHRPWFMSYKPSFTFVIYLLSFIVILAFSNFVSILRKRKNKVETKTELNVFKTSLAFLLVFAITFLSHFSTFNTDVKKIIEADFYCYTNNPEKTAKAATSLRAYNFSANLNYNLVMSKTGKLTDKFFSFIQIKGTESLHPDIDFATELSFIASDFYYDLGFISEARHWAYESLVFYPYSIRAMQNLVKIHLVTGEYKAAERTLNTLKKGLIGQKFVRQFLPYISDTNLIASNYELLEKRSFIPAENELNRLIEGRFKELLNANSSNKKAFEYLMLFYLLDVQPEKFIDLYKNADKYFDKMPDVYEEALLTFKNRTQQSLPPDIKISSESQKRFDSFMQELKKYKGKTRLARNNLYAEYGKTYMYFLKFVYPYILESDIINDEDDYPEI